MASSDWLNLVMWRLLGKAVGGIVEASKDGVCFGKLLCDQKKGGRDNKPGTSKLPHFEHSVI